MNTVINILHIQHHPASHILLKVPWAHTSLGRSSFQFAAASDSNELQQTLKLDSFISISSFKDSIMDTLTDSCGCFAWYIVVSTFLPFVLLSVPNNVCTMFCAVTMLCCYMLLSCCVFTMLFCRVLLPCYVVVFGLSLCVLCCLSCRDVCFVLYIYIYIYFFFYPPPVPAGGHLPFGRPSL